MYPTRKYKTFTFFWFCMFAFCSFQRRVFACFSLFLDCVFHNVRLFILTISGPCRNTRIGSKYLYIYTYKLVQKGEKRADKGAQRGKAKLCNIINFTPDRVECDESPAPDWPKVVHFLRKDGGKKAK